MKILHIGEYVIGGVSTYLKEILEYQKNHPDIQEVNLLVSRIVPNDEFPLSKKNIFFYKHSRSIKNFLCSIIQLKHYITEINPNIFRKKKHKSCLLSTWMVFFNGDFVD